VFFLNDNGAESGPFSRSDLDGMGQVTSLDGKSFVLIIDADRTLKVTVRSVCEAVNLAGAKWVTPIGVQTFGSSQPGYGVRNTITGEFLVSSDGVGPACYRTKRTAGINAAGPQEDTPTIRVLFR